MIRKSFLLVQNSNHALNLKVYELILDYLKIPIGVYLVYQVVMKSSPESGERHLVILPCDDGCDPMTDGFYPLEKLSTRFVAAHEDLVQNGVDGIVLFGGGSVLVIRYQSSSSSSCFGVLDARSISTWKTGISSLSLRWIRSSGRMSRRDK